MMGLYRTSPTKSVQKVERGSSRDNRDVMLALAKSYAAGIYIDYTVNY